MRSNSPEAREETNEGDFKAELVAQKESAGRMELGRTVGAFDDSSGCRAVAESAGLIEIKRSSERWCSTRQVRTTYSSPGRGVDEMYTLHLTHPKRIRKGRTRYKR